MPDNSLVYIYFHAYSLRSNYLLSNLSFSLIVHITSFWKRQRIHDFDTILYPEYFAKMEHLI